MYEHLSGFLTRPAVFSTSTVQALWTDPHIARQMLRLHLDGTSDLASRRPAAIDAFVAWLDARIPVAGRAVLDLGCGPGLYAERFARRGAKVTGIDFSEVSIAHARQSAQTAGLVIEYRLADYLEAELPAGQDLVTMIYGDFCALSPAVRRLLLDKVRGALAPEGRFVFDVFSAGMLTVAREETTCERRLMDGFWAEGEYVGLKTRFVYPEVAVGLDRYLVVTPERTFTIDNWLQYYTPASIAAEMRSAALAAIGVADILTGDEWDGGPTAFAVIAER